MSIRVDHQGYLLDAQGRRLDAKEGNDKASIKKRFDKIVADWKVSNPKDRDGPGKEVSIMQVESGDNQWDIAGGSGADERTTYLKMNKHHENPHLIHAGDLVFVAPTTRVSTFRNGTYKGQDNIDIFRDQQQAQAEAGASQDSLGKQAAGFFNSVSDAEVKDSAFLMALEGLPNEGDDPKAAALNRQASVRGYLQTFDESERAQKLQELRNTYDPAIIFKGNKGDYPDEQTAQDYERYNAAVDAAAKDLGLPDRQPSTGEGQPSTDGTSTEDTGKEQPASAVTDSSGKPITEDWQLNNIYSAAKQSGGKMDDKDLKNKISDYIKVDAGGSKDVIDRVKKLLAIKFGEHDGQVEDYVAEYISTELAPKIREGDFGRTGDEKENFIRSYLKALPDSSRERAVEGLLDDSQGRGDYGVTRKRIGKVAEELGLKHDVVSFL